MKFYVFCQFNSSGLITPHLKDRSANYFGVSRRTVARWISSLKSHGFIYNRRIDGKARIVGKHKWLHKNNFRDVRTYTVKTTSKNIKELNGLLVSGFAKEVVKNTRSYNKYFHKNKFTTENLTYGVGVALTQFEKHLNISRPTAIKLKKEAINLGFLSTSKKYLSKAQLIEREWDRYPSEVSKKDVVKLIDILVQDGLSSYFEIKKSKTKFKLLFRDVDEFHFSESLRTIKEIVKP